MDALAIYERLADRAPDAEARSEMARRAEALDAVESETPVRGRVAALRMVARQFGFSYGTLSRHYYAWRGRRENAVCDLRRERRAGPAGSLAWTEALKAYAENDLNTTLGGYRRMMAEFRGGATLPCGIGTWADVWRRERPGEEVPDSCPADWTPRGASFGNLARALRVDPDTVFALSASRQGMRAARRHLLPVLTSRVGLPVGAVYEFDDVWHNVDIMLPTGKTAQPLEFAGYDVASAFKCASVVKPRFTSEDGSRRNLTEQQFRFLLGHTLCVVGFHKDGVRNVVEHGTTAIRDGVEKQIRNIPGFGALISFERSGILSEQVHAGLFIGSGGGNFRRKALVEGAHNILHNRTASLPGNRGRDAARMHESRNALVRYEESTAAALERAGGPGFSVRMASGLLSFEEYLAAFRRAEDSLMDDPDHRLEGWDGREVAEYRLGADAPWRDASELLRMADDEARAVAAFLSAHPECRRRRWMTRREVWRAGQSDFVRVPLFEMPAFLAPGDALELTVSADGLISFRNAVYYGRDEVFYRAEARDRVGAVRRFAPGARLVVFWNPLVADRVWIVDRESGKTLGTASMFRRAPVYDRAAVLHALGEQSRDLARKVLPVRGRHQREAEERAARIAANAALLREASGGLFGRDPDEDAARAAAAAGPAGGNLRDLFPEPNEPAPEKLEALLV